MIHQGVYEAGSKISGFIDRHLIMASISGQNAVQSFPVPWNAGAEQLYVKSPDGYWPPVLKKFIRY
jgi:hypothetical protein